MSLHRMSDTRWSARIDAVKPLVKRPREILHSLHTLKEDFDLPGDLYNEVTSLTTWFQSFEFVVLATFWFKTLQAVNDVSCLLQGTQLTLDEEIQLLKSLLNDLQRIRESWSVLIEEASVVAVNLGFEESLKQKRLRRSKIYFDEDRRNAYEHANEEERFRVDVFMLFWTNLFRRLKQGFKRQKKLITCFHSYGIHLRMMLNLVLQKLSNCQNSIRVT